MLPPLSSRRRAAIARQSIARPSAVHFTLGPALGACAALVLVASPARRQDLRYALPPTAEQLQWADALGLDDTCLYGARLGLVFGKLVELNGFYLTSQGTDARVRDLYSRLGVNGTPPQNPGLDVKNYGANVVLNFGTGT